MGRGPARRIGIVFPDQRRGLVGDFKAVAGLLDQGHVVGQRLLQLGQKCSRRAGIPARHRDLSCVHDQELRKDLTASPRAELRLQQIPSIRIADIAGLRRLTGLSLYCPCPKSRLQEQPPHATGEERKSFLASFEKIYVLQTRHTQCFSSHALFVAAEAGRYRMLVAERSRTAAIDASAVVPGFFPGTIR